MKYNGYDERQRIDILKSYRLGFWFMSGYLMLIPVLYHFLKKHTDLLIICIAGFIITYTIIIIFTIFKGSHIKLHESKGGIKASLILLNIAFVLYSVSVLINGSIFKDGRLSSNFMFMLFCSPWPIISICYFIKEHHDRKEK